MRAASASIAFFTGLVASQCYYPGPTLAGDHRPCSPYSRTSLCCPVGWTCYSNSLCVITDPDSANSTSPIGTTIRGTCTNPEWDRKVCGDFCLNEPIHDNSGLLDSCGGRTYCCAADTTTGLCSCKNGKGTFDVDAGTSMTVIGVKTAIASSVVLPFETSVNSVTSSTTAIIVSQRSATDSTVHPPTATTTAETPSPKSTTQTVGFKIGVGAGAGIAGLLLLLGLFVLGWRIRRKHKQRDSGEEEPLREIPIISSVRENPTSFNPQDPSPHPYGDGAGQYAGSEAWKSTLSSHTEEAVSYQDESPRGPRQNETLPEETDYAAPITPFPRRQAPRSAQHTSHRVPRRPTPQYTGRFERYSEQANPSADPSSTGPRLDYEDFHQRGNETPGEHPYTDRSQPRYYDSRRSQDHDVAAQHLNPDWRPY